MAPVDALAPPKPLRRGAEIADLLLADAAPNRPGAPPTGFALADDASTPPGAETPPAILRSMTPTNALKLGGFSLDGDRADSVDLRSFDSPVKDQGDRGTCYAHAIAAVYENIVKQRTGQTIDLSEEHIVDAIASVRDLENDSSLSDSDYTRILKAVGPIGFEHEWPYSKTKHYPAPGPLSFGVTVRRGTESVTSQDFSYVTDLSSVQRMLSEGRPLILNLNTNVSWSGNTTGNIRSKAKADEKTKHGYHSVALVGYQVDKRLSGGGAFIIKNSWDSDWGDGGYGYVPFDYCADLTCWVHRLSDVDISTQAIQKAYNLAAPPPPQLATDGPGRLFDVDPGRHNLLATIKVRDLNVARIEVTQRGCESLAFDAEIRGVDTTGRVYRLKRGMSGGEAAFGLMSKGVVLPFDNVTIGYDVDGGAAGCQFRLNFKAP